MQFLLYGLAIAILRNNAILLRGDGNAMQTAVGTAVVVTTANTLSGLMGTHPHKIVAASALF